MKSFIAFAILFSCSNLYAENIDHGSGAIGGPDKDLDFGKIDGQSNITITCHNLTLEEKIDGQSYVVINASGSITIKGKIDGQSTVIVNSSTSISVGDKVDGQSQLSLHSTGPIDVKGKLDGGPANNLPASCIKWWAPSLTIDGGICGGTSAPKINWGNFPDKF
jgi:hypothetical protein